MAQPIGSLLVEIGSDVTGLLDGSRKGSKALGDLSSNAAKLGVEMAKVGAAVAVAATGEFLEAFKNQVIAQYEAQRASKQ